MKNLLLLLTFSLSLNTLFAQTQKHRWILGGTGLVHAKMRHKLITDRAVFDVRIRQTQLHLLPNAGYFFTDQFVAGIKLLYAANRSKVLSGTDLTFGHNTEYGAGPFVRYYILPGKKKFNLLLDGTYQFATQKVLDYLYFDGQPQYSYVTTHRGHTAVIAGGPVLNLGSKFGLELLVSYSTSKYSTTKYQGYRGKSNFLMTGLGLQVYL